MIVLSLQTTSTYKRIKLMRPQATDEKEDTHNHDNRGKGSLANSELELHYFLQVIFFSLFYEGPCCSANVSPSIKASV